MAPEIGLFGLGIAMLATGGLIVIGLLVALTSDQWKPNPLGICALIAYLLLGAFITGTFSGAAS